MVGIDDDDDDENIVDIDDIDGNDDVFDADIGKDTVVIRGVFDLSSCTNLLFQLLRHFSLE